MDEIILRNENGQIVTSSRDVAEKFGKRHDSVLRDIDNLLKMTKEDTEAEKEFEESDSTKLWSEMFIESTYVNSRGKEYRCYLMNRDGFSLLAMGFTGKDALEWKLKYINAFNMMEEKLNNPYKLPSTYKEALIQLVEKVEENERLLEDNEHKQEIINGFTDDIDIYKKKDIINRICRRRHENYANRYTELYRCFRETNHIDLEARCEGYNLKQTKKKDKLSVIRYAEQFGHIDDLYSCCVKLYESEVKAIIKQLNELQN